MGCAGSIKAVKLDSKGMQLLSTLPANKKAFLVPLTERRGRYCFEDESHPKSVNIQTLTAKTQ